MILDHHIEYLKQTLEPEEGYPYSEMYEWSNEYILAYNVLLMYADNRRCIPEYLKELIERYPWKDRYSSIAQHGTFYDNIVHLESLRYYETAEDAWRISLDLQSIPHEMAYFEICYCWMNPGRLFTNDYRMFDAENHKHIVPEREGNAWHFVDKMYKKISREHLPMCTIEDFLLFPCQEKATTKDGCLFLALNILQIFS